MTSGECADVVHRLILAYPTLTVDPDRCLEISRKLEPYPRDVATQAVEEYVDHGGDRMLELPRLMAIVNRHHRVVLEREAGEKRKLQLEREAAQGRVLKSKYTIADELLNSMTDEEVMHEAQSVLAIYSGITREWAAKWTAATWRNNSQLRLKVAKMTQQTA